MPSPSDGILEHKTLLRAIEKSGLTNRQFAARILGRGERTLRYWLAGSPIPPAAAAFLKAYADGEISIRLNPRVVGG